MQPAACTDAIPKAPVGMGGTITAAGYLWLALWLAMSAMLLAPAAAIAQSSPYFEIDRLNPGLPDPPPSVDRRTAHGAMASFIDLTELGDYEAARHLLNLSALPEGMQAQKGAELARELGLVIDRKVIVPWDSLLDRPDNLDATGSDRLASAGEPRYSVLIGRIENGRRDGAIRLNRVKPGNGDPAWVFSRETVAQIEAFYRQHGPTALERALPAGLKMETFFGLALWELIALPVLIVVALGIGRLSYLAFRSAGEQANGTIASVVFDSMRWPSVIAIVASVLLISTSWIFVFSGPISTIVNPLIAIGFIAAILLFGLKLIDTLMRQFVTFDMGELAEHDQDATRSLATSMAAVRRALIVVAVLVSGGVFLTSVQLFGALGLSILASAGAITLIFGFAARRVLGNILASLQIALNRSARIGDQVLFEDTWCTVERIHFTFVQLKIWNEDRLIVPVERFVSDKFINYTLATSQQIRTVKLTLAQTVDMEAMREAFMDMLAEQDGVIAPKEAMMRVYDQDAFGVVLRFQFRAEDPNKGWTAECELREKLMTAAQKLENESDVPTLPSGGMDMPDGG
ncbi:mechanosensitive ion channel family protein [Profundibacterium mesophilum]|uniref:MscS Mechanosensitive ion channel n=1 Tax=Profundibacterium mesophilum KAUST100406-0324 TaxID=1037889 RepID=A0A921TCS1_9RHOB|nr:mechanosensitive ion channel family protein [Profundibacterium mesophilum]KAF0677445.1 MscS Mechanosensitive ion channel [Profundibacterium mesophilum KAUST100406-0324]